MHFRSGGIFVAAVVISLSPHVAHAQVSHKTESDVIDELYDLVGRQPPFYTFVNPVRAETLLTFTQAGAMGGEGVSTDLLWAGRTWGRVFLLPDLTANLFASHSQLVPVLGGTLVRVEDQYVCRSLSTGSLQFEWPVGQEFFNLVKDSTFPGCKPREWLAYYGDVLEFDSRPTNGFWALRAIDAGLSMNVLSTGRTRDAFRRFLEFRVGGDIDIVEPGDAASAGTDVAGRVAAGVRAGVASQDGAVRAAVEAMFRQRMVVFDDQLVDVSADVTWVLVASSATVLALTARAALEYSRRPWMVVSNWADPSQQVSGLAAVRFELDWRTGPLPF